MNGGSTFSKKANLVNFLIEMRGEKKSKFASFVFSQDQHLVLNLKFSNLNILLTQRAFTCSKSTIETLEQGVKYVQS